MSKQFSIAALALGWAFLPALVAAHTAGPQDRYGCHDNRNKGGYHCHTGDYSGLDFGSKHEMIEALSHVVEMHPQSDWVYP